MFSVPRVKQGDCTVASWDFQENNFQSVEGYVGGFEGMKGKRESL